MLVLFTARYDSEKIYNGTEFLIQRFDENVDDWVIVSHIRFILILTSKFYIIFFSGSD